MTLAERFQEKGRKQGIGQGIERGIEQGIEQGRQQGETTALAKTAIKLITKYVAPVSEELKKRIYQQEIGTLEKMIDHIDEWNTIEEVKGLLK